METFLIIAYFFLFMHILGIDEAGRGPVIGPMVMAGVVIKPSDEDKLLELGVKDSKMLTPRKREELFLYIKSHYPYRYVVIPPSEIDTHVNSDDSNLNLLEALHTAGIINHFAKKIDRAIIDCPSNNIEAYKRIIEKKLIKRIELIVEHGADKKYIVVSAASIIAKVIRDNLIEDLKNRIGIDFGSGYPSDPATREFLEKYFDKYDFFRKSWSSWNKLKNGKNKSLKDYMD